MGDDSIGILIDKVSHAYGENVVLREISLTVLTGESIGITGTSGGGKSTLLKLLSGLYTVQTGRIEVEGETDPVNIRRHVAMVMQNAVLIPGSIKDNITCGHAMSNKRIQRACEAAQLADWISTLPQGINTNVGERGGKVSGGQGQRIAIARAIAKQASVILLDEATSALDGSMSQAFILALRSLTEGKTVISVTHRPETLTNCTRIYRLEGGVLHDA